ncbi:hypothetical protein [Burkholderia cenocepacia]|uniref:hypothetical protein n=1 Tax=Burkholderia cenocepacia TaxID=95486 RepID=UPI002230A21A|nr:hypothetical protein [Burkholderia cenocepacia]
MATNDFLVFGGGSSPNVIDQATYAALSARLSGFQSGTALSAQLNKVWRQSSIMAAVLAQFTANFSGQNAVDDGTTATLLANLQTAINAAGITAPQFDNSTKLATTAFVGRAAGNFQTRKYVSGSATLVTSDTGSWIEAGGTGPSTITLPAPATSNLTYTVTNVTSNGTAVTISTPSGSIYNQASASPTFSLDVGATVELASDASNWTVISHYTRSPIAQTPAQFDSSTRLATTAFVQRALGNFQNFYSYQTSQALIGAQSGSVVNFWGTSAETFTLPAASTMPTCGSLYFVNSGSATLTVLRAGSDTIVSAGGTTSVVLNPGDSLLLVTTNGANQWIAIGGTAQLPFASTAQLTSGGVVGAVRNAAMNVSTASASATFTADEIVVETVLGGGFFRLANFNKTINLATTGAGGMDTGVAPASGYVALYAIYNPTTGASGLLAKNATSAVQPNVYGGANMPAGYTASALVSVWPTNGSGQLVVGYQNGRTFYAVGVAIFSTTTTVTSYTSLNISNTVPPNAIKFSGVTVAQATNPTSSIGSNFAASASGIGGQNCQAGGYSGTGQTIGNFTVPVITPQTIYYTFVAPGATSPSLTIYPSSYEF